jgi:N-methylhydantoinase A
LKSRAAKWAASENLKMRELRYDLSFDMRYVGQNFELMVPIVSGAVLDPGAVPDSISLPDAAHLKQLFFDAHDVAYSFHDPLARVELLNARLTARAPVVGAVDAPLKESLDVAPLAVGKREIYFDDDRPVAAPVYRREDLLPGVQIPGPAVIDQTDTTIPVFPGDRLAVHASGNLIIEVVR